MEVYLYVELNLFASFILLLIYLNIRHRIKKYLTEQKLFLGLLGLNFIILLTDSFMWVLDGTRIPVLKIILYVMTILFYFTAPLICALWFLYVDFQINRSERHLKKIFVPLMIPVFINLILTVLSNFYNVLYYFDSNSVYHRGKYFFILVAVTYFYLIYSFLYILYNKKKIHKPYFFPILMFSIPPFIGGIFQAIFFGISCVWISMTFSLLIIFIHIQNEQMYLDYLTGLYNRRQLDLYLQDLIGKNKSTRIAGIMLDLNSFKSINDLYGHNAGDEALKHLALILKRSFECDAFLSRYGGDEFVILLEINDFSELKKNLDILKENIQDFNRKAATTYALNISIGADCYDRRSGMTGQEFLMHIDALMYQDKELFNKENSKVHSFY